jgi:pilus assembly protein Flp/PilA
MRKYTEMLKRLGRDEDGTALVEYSILLGVIAVAVIGFAVGVGGWAAARFTDLCTALQASGIGACASGAGS